MMMRMMMMLVLFYSYASYRTGVSTVVPSSNNVSMSPLACLLAPSLSFIISLTKDDDSQLFHLHTGLAQAAVTKLFSTTTEGEGPATEAEVRTGLMS